MGIQARVLVADDDADYLDLVSDAIESMGFEVVRATSGADLMSALAEYGPFDLVVTDISMPWMSGLQAMQSARYAGFATPIIVMTGLKDPHVADQVSALGHSAVLLRKPFSLNELKAAVIRLLETVGAAHAGSVF